MTSKLRIIFPVFISSVLLISLVNPKSASAAISPGSSRDNCIEGMKARDAKGNPIFSNAEIKAYGLKRVQVREARLNKIESTLLNTTRTNYNYYNSKVGSVQNAISAIDKKKVESLDGIAYDPAYNFSFSNVPARTLDMAYFESVFANARAVVTTAGTSLNSYQATNEFRGRLMYHSCSAIHDAQVFNVVLPTAKRSYILSRVDILNLVNSGLNVSRQQTIAGVYKAKKAVDPNFDSDGAISSSAGFSANPLAEQGALGEVASQAGGDSVALNSRLDQIADSIINYNSAEELGSTFSDVLSTPAVKPKQ